MRFDKRQSLRETRRGQAGEEIKRKKKNKNALATSGLWEIL
jgi:hypothetical protein